VNRNLNLVAAAFALTALSYGLARFAYGLLLPQTQDGSVAVHLRLIVRESSSLFLATADSVLVRSLSWQA
jgi:hypothetical protein